MDNDFDHFVDDDHDDDDSSMSNETNTDTIKDELAREPVVIRPSILPLVCYT